MIYEVVIVGLDVLGMWIGPLPEVVCLMINMAKSFGVMTFVSIITILTTMKYIFLCVLRRVPEFDDDKISKIIIGTVMIFGGVITGVKFGFWNNPSLNEVKNKSNELIHYYQRYFFISF